MDTPLRINIIKEIKEMKLKEIKQKGFTMIELVIVIAILGILAAFALPRFANFTNQTNAAVASNFNGTANAAIGIIKAKYIAGGSTGSTVTLDGAVIAVKPNGDLKIDNQTDCNNLKLIHGNTPNLYSGFATNSQTGENLCIFMKLDNGSYYTTHSVYPNRSVAAIY